jgi:hypothetical protein
LLASLVSLLAFLVVSTSPGLEALKPEAATFQNLVAAADRKHEPAGTELLSRATHLEDDLRDWPGTDPAENAEQAQQRGLLTTGQKGHTPGNCHPDADRRCRMLARRGFSSLPGRITPPPLVMDDWHSANLCNRGPALKTELEGFSIELDDRDLQPGTARHHIVRYTARADHPRRVQPVAQGPREFVDEWLHRDWKEAIDWSAPPGRNRTRETWDSVLPGPERLRGE